MAPTPTAYSTKTQATAEATHPAPLALTDDQFDQIMRHATVLHPQLRRVFVEHVAYELRGQVVGVGTVYRACAKVLKESGMLSPPSPGVRPAAAGPLESVRHCGRKPLCAYSAVIAGETLLSP